MQAEVRLPNGEYRTSQTDLKVKATGAGLGGGVARYDFDGPWCGKDLGGPSCSVSFSAGAIEISSDVPFCGNGGASAGLGRTFRSPIKIGAAISVCYTLDLGCSGARCECDG